MIRDENKVREFNDSVKEMADISAQISNIEFSAVTQVRETEAYKSLLEKQKVAHKKLTKIYG